jgi:hypothetical protein
MAKVALRLWLFTLHAARERSTICRSKHYLWAGCIVPVLCFAVRRHLTPVIRGMRHGNIATRAVSGKLDTF